MTTTSGTDPLGVALLGATGMWGPRLAEAGRRSGSVRVVTAHARDRERLEEVAARLGAEPAATLDAALGHPEVEAVLIATPNDVHAEQALAAAARGLHASVEKPLADTVAAAERIRDAFEEAGLVLAVGHEMRRLGAARRAKELVDEGALGTVVLAEANWSLTSRLSPSAWRWHRDRAPGGPLLQLGIHHADTLAYLLGPIARSSGSFGHVATEAESDDVGVVTLEFAGGARGVITGSYVSPRTYFLRLYGTEGVLEYVGDLSVWPRAEAFDAASTLTLRTADGARPVPFAPRDPLAEQLDEFARCIREGGRPETGGGEGIAALRVIEEALA